MKSKTKILMKLIFSFQKTALYFAIEKGNIEIIQAILTNSKIDVNIKSIQISNN